MAASFRRVYNQNILLEMLFSDLPWLVNVLYLANSMVIPFVYSFRMQIFKNALNKRWKKQAEKVQSRPVSPQVRGQPVEPTRHL